LKAAATASYRSSPGHWTARPVPLLVRSSDVVATIGAILLLAYCLFRSELLDGRSDQQPVEGLAMTITAVLMGLALSLAFFVLTTGLVLLLLVKLPADHFCRESHPTGVGRRSPRAWASFVAKNLAALLTVMAGVLLTLPGIPGPGLVLILLGIGLSDFPGKRRLERLLLGRRSVLRTINGLRARFGKPPLMLAAEANDRSEAPASGHEGGPG
jgi:hypothetical protein